jgi:hypothetical protein
MILLVTARSFLTRNNIQSFRKLLLQHLDIIYSKLDLLEQESLVNDLFIPLDPKDLVQLLSLLVKFKRIELIRFVVEYYSLDWLLDQNLDYLDWEEWINIQFAISVKFSISANVKLYTDLLQNYDKTAKSGMEVYKILAKAIRVGDVLVFLQILKDCQKYQIVSDLLVGLTMFEQEVFMSKYLEFLALDSTLEFSESCRYLKGIVESKDCSLVMVLENRLFLKFQDYQTNHLMVHAFVYSQDRLSRFAKSLIENWGNKGLVLSNSVKSCVNYTKLLLLVLEHLQDEYLSRIRMNLISGIFKI